MRLTPFPMIRFGSNEKPQDNPKKPLSLDELKQTPATGDGFKKTSHKIPQNVGMRLFLALLKKQPPPISVFLTSKSDAFSEDQKKQLAELGVTVNHIAGNIHTGRIIDLDKFDMEKIEKLDFLAQIEAGAKMSPRG